MRAARPRLAVGWASLGLAGSLALSAAASQLLQGEPVRWWAHFELGSRALAHQVFWSGVGALCLAWLGLGLELHRAGAARRRGAGGGGRPAATGLTPAALTAIGALWAAPLIAGPALFSRDMYSYLADGELLRAGLDPYAHAPAALASIHHLALLHAVSPFWRHTTSPYGPLFTGLAAAVASIYGGHIVLGVILLRALEVAGVALLAVFVPRLARALGADPAWASWAVVISPLTLLELIAAGHNDALMAGLLACGVYLAVRRRPLAAIALCALATAVKLPAAAAAVMIGICWLRSGERPAGAVAEAAGVFAAVLAALSAVSGVGARWLSGSLLSVPGKVHLAITPATALGFSLHSLLRTLDVVHSAGSQPYEAAFGHALTVLLVLAGLWLCWRVRYERLAGSLAALLLAAVLLGPATWPWYLSWGLALVACLPGAQRSSWLVAVSVAPCFVVYPNGTVDLPLSSSPYVLAGYAAAVALGGWIWRRRVRRRRKLPTFARRAQAGAGARLPSAEVVR
jgi:alpha-1,6-mannosyltransferase